MTTNLKAIYEQGVLRLKEPLSLPDGTQVDVTVTSHEEENGEQSQRMEDRSWDALTQLLAECAIDNGVPDLASQHDHYLYGIPKRLKDADSTR
ncbi:MAG: antitoxin family protein [Pyrinomonadaceae bacterium]|nr:antitoxin family protein [Pyrinomonadaceae bacterium]